MDELIFSAQQKLKALLQNQIDDRGRAFFVDKPLQGRRLVMTDIHGCFQTFARMLDKIDLKKEDQLFILGDLINRGPYSLLVLQKVMELLNRGYNVFPIRGNHEHILIKNQNDSEELNQLAKRQFSSHLLSAGKLHSAITDFASLFPFFYETDRAFLVHAGFDTESSKTFSKWKSMIWIRDFVYNAMKMKGKRVIHGHVPVTLREIESSLDRKAMDINLDNGCVRARDRGYGLLVCLDLDSGKLITQKNVDLSPA